MIHRKQSGGSICRHTLILGPKGPHHTWFCTSALSVFLLSLCVSLTLPGSTRLGPPSPNIGREAWLWWPCLHCVPVLEAWQTGGAYLSLSRLESQDNAPFLLPIHTSSKMPPSISCSWTMHNKNCVLPQPRGREHVQHKLINKPVIDQSPESLGDE